MSADSLLPPPVAAAARPGTLPLCVDLDGTLIRSDMLEEGIAAAAGDPRLLAAMLRLAGGRAAFKQRIAALAEKDPALLPYNEPLLALLRAHHAAGRQLVLATAADRAVAERIADHLGLFDAVIASDGANNMKGRAKAAALVERFGPKGFAYAGNSASDLPIWREAGSAIVVNAPRAVAARARAAAPVEHEIDNRAGAMALLRAMRPHQWVKNLLVFLPILTAHAVGDLSAWTQAGLAFAALCLTASAIYIINDILDVAADRAHPHKRNRPFARGAARLSHGVLLSGALLCGGLALGLAAGALWVVAVYAAMSVAYSVRLKQLPLVDVFMLAGLYVIRIVAGGEATGHRLSLWLMGFSSFLFLGLALLKRVEELMAAGQGGQGGQIARRGYSPADVPILTAFGCGAAFSATLVLALFVQSEATAALYASPGLLWGSVPLMLFWQCRMWLSASRGYMHHDPIVYAARDRVSWAVGLALVVVLAAAKSTTLFATW